MEHKLNLLTLLYAEKYNCLLSLQLRSWHVTEGHSKYITNG